MSTVLSGAVLLDTLADELRHALRDSERAGRGRPSIVLADRAESWLRLDGSREMFGRLLAALESKDAT